MSRGGILMQARQHFPTVNIWKHDVQHDNVGRSGRDLLKHSLPLGDMDDMISGLFRGAPVKAHHVGVIVHDQYGDSAHGGQSHPQEGVIAVNMDLDVHVLWDRQVTDQIVPGGPFIPCSDRAYEGNFDVSVLEPCKDRDRTAGGVPGHPSDGRDQYLAKY